ncbi:MAG: tetratricopeptide repeat protein [Thermoguttaceae bacterium]
MKAFPFFASCLISFVLFTGTIWSQENGEVTSVPDFESKTDKIYTFDPEIVASADPNNPGMTWLDRATDEKLTAESIDDLGRVIFLCKQAKEKGLSPDNLDFCNQLMAAAQIQRALIMSQNLVKNQEKALPANWKNERTKILADLEEAVSVIKNQPLPFLRIAQLQLLPEGDKNRALTALQEAESKAKGEPGIFAEILLLKISLETDPEKQEKMIAAIVQDHFDPQLLLAHTMALIELKRFDGALKVLRSILEKEPENIPALATSYDLLVGMEKYEEGLQVLDLLEKASQDENIPMLRIRLLVRMKKMEEANKMLRELREKSPENIPLLALSFDLLLELKQYDEALKILDLLEAKASDENVPLMRAKLLAQMKRVDEAIEILDQLRKKNPDNVGILLLRSGLFQENKQPDRALVDLDAALKMLPKHPLILLEKGKILVALERYEDANALADDFLADHVEADEFRLLKLQICLAQKNFDGAISLVKEFQQKAPDNKLFQVMLAQILFEQKKMTESLELLNKLLESDAVNIDLLRIKAQIMISTGRHKEAAELLESVLKEDSEDVVSINNLSWILSTSPTDEIRDGKRALELATKACEMTDYQKAYILSTLAAAYAEIGDFESALKWSQKSIDLSSEDDTLKDRVDDLKKELQSYQKKEPFRELTSETENTPTK